MVETRRGNAASRSQRTANDAREHSTPPPPSLATAIAAILDSRGEQTELLRHIAQNLGNNHPSARPVDALSTYQDFVNTQPPLFHKAEDPMEADGWLRIMESKFSLLQCTEETKTLFATQQLRGSAWIWWDNYHAMLPAERQVTWAEFKEAFRGHHIPAGIMARKLIEFLALKQGQQTVLQYAQAFNRLSQYAGSFVDTDEKKQTQFRRGMTSKLQDRLATADFASFDQLVSKAIIQEDAYLARQQDKKRKAPVESSRELVTYYHIG